MSVRREEGGKESREEVVARQDVYTIWKSQGWEQRR